MSPLMPPPEPSPMDGVRAVAKQFDPLGLASAVAALHTLPVNGHRLWRLGVMSAIAAEQARTSELGAPTVEDLERLLNGGPLAEVAARMDDPFDDVLCQEVTFHGGSYRVSAGLAEEAVYIFRLLVRAWLLTDALPDELIGELTRMTVGALRLSDAALRRAGLTRNAAPEEGSNGVTIPDPTELRALQQALAFGAGDIRAKLPDRLIEALEPITIDAGAEAFTDEQLFEGAADAWPLLRADDWWILARPFDVLVGLRHVLAHRVCGSEGCGLPAQLFGRQVDRDVVRSFSQMGLRAEVISERTVDTPFTEIRARCDVDKVIVALVITDDLRGLSEDNPYSPWGSLDYLDPAHEKLEAVAEELRADSDEVLGLVVLQSVGTFAIFGMREPIAPNLMLTSLTAGDLHVLAFLEVEEPLNLWKFARATADLESGGRLIRQFSALDGYALYRNGERSFARMYDATMVVMSPGEGGDLRREARQGRDRHGQVYVDGSVREVEHADTEDVARESLYHLTEIVEPRLVRFVAGAPLALWVAGPEAEVRRTWDAVDSVAYWLSELRAPLQDALDELAMRIPCLQVEVEFADPDFWYGEAPDPGGGEDGSLEVTAPVNVLLTLGPGIRRLIPKPDNAGERLLVGLLVDAVSELRVANGLPSIADNQRSAAVEAAAPLGVKKHLLILSVEANPMMEPADGGARPVQEADLTQAREKLGRHLAAAFPYSNAHIPHDRRNDVLKDAVDFLFGVTRQAIDCVQSDGVLEDVMTRNERLIADSERRRTILPARLATYPGSAATLRADVSRANQASACCRFLVEYVAAQPPGGDARWSLGRYDEALASVAELIDWANLSDAVYGGTSNVDLLMRKDGQLRLVEYDRYELGRSQYFDRYIEADTQSSRERWADRFSTEATESSSIAERLDPWMPDEAQVTLSELGETLVAANLVARDRDDQVVVLDRAQAIAALAEQLERKKERVEPAVDYLSMGPRADFLAPPDGSAKDTFPWLFARRWSYNRRPFIRRTVFGRDELLWGRRQVVQSLNIIVGQMGSGRYQALADAKSLRKELGRIADETGAEFEREVAEIFAGPERYAVKTAVKRIDGERLQRPNGEPLGDIDVLAGDRERKILWAVECKDLSGALSNADVVREMTEHFRQVGTTSVTKHAERVAWLGQRIPGALTALNLPSNADGWTVSGLVVTGKDVLAPFIDDIPFDVVAVRSLPDYLAGQ
jgi:hypothetical protein